MSQTARCLVLLGCFSSLGFAGPAKHADDPETGALPRINVRVYNYAEVSDYVLGRAQKKASAIFQLAGVELNWVPCPCSEEEIPIYASCSQLSSGPAVVYLGIMPREMSDRIGVPPGVLGLSFMPDPDRFAYSGFIFQDRVQLLAQRKYGTPQVILGHALAHELGHLLLGQGSHSRRGLMQLPWTDKVLRLASEARLVFSGEEAASIRRQVRARIQ